MSATLLIFSPAFLLASNKAEDPVVEETKDKLVKISKSDPHFKWAVEELMKTFYRESDWPSFFAYAQYYRKRWPLSERNQTQLLEVLALLRHCQNELVEKFVDAYKKEIPSYAEKLEQMRSLSHTRFRGKSAIHPEKNPLSQHFEGVSLWPLPSSEIAKVDPQKLKVKVENRCPF